MSMMQSFTRFIIPVLEVGAMLLIAFCIVVAVVVESCPPASKVFK
jgi:hypothetical protein